MPLNKRNLPKKIKLDDVPEYIPDSPGLKQDIVENKDIVTNSLEELPKIPIKPPVEADEKVEIVEQVKVNKVPVIKAVKERELECPSCHNVQKWKKTQDPTTSWCEKCGKAFLTDWKAHNPVRSERWSG
jgi:hypothetical protein